jgi:hypothetical protein
MTAEVDRAIQKVAAARARFDESREEFKDAVRAAVAAGASLRDLEEVAGVRRSRLSQIVRDA